MCEDERWPLDSGLHARCELDDRQTVRAAPDSDAAERPFRGDPDPVRELGGVPERRVRVEGEVVREERGVRGEERLQSAPLTAVDDERLVPPEETVMDEDHVRTLGSGALEQLPRARDAAGEHRHVVAPDHLEPRRSELGPALHFEERVGVRDDLVPAGHANSLEARSRAIRPDSDIHERVPCGRSGCGAAW